MKVVIVVSESQKQKVIVIVGPTAVGKTKLSLEVAKKFNGEIISGDSMQVYRGMDIGTAKIKPEEMEGIPHHLLDIKNPDKNFSVAEFQLIVRRKIDEISRRGAIPIIVGGTGLYIQAVLFDYQFPEIEENPNFREKMQQLVTAGKGAELFQQLENIDPETAKKVHPNNYRRIIRALEIYKFTGKTMSEWQKNQQQTPLYDAIIIGLNMERELLYDRINRRVDQMIAHGLVEEVKRLYNQGLDGTYQSMKAIGYKELIEYIEGKCSLEEAVENIKKNSRNFAKRQLTWFRNKLDVMWFDINPKGEDWKKTTEIIDFIAGKLK